VQLVYPGRKLKRKMGTVTKQSVSQIGTEPTPYYVSMQPITSGSTTSQFVSPGLSYNPATQTLNLTGSVSGLGSLNMRGDIVSGGQLTAAAVRNSGVFYYTARTITANVTVSATESALSVGPVAIADGVVVTIANGGEWSVV